MKSSLFLLSHSHLLPFCYLSIKFQSVFQVKLKRNRGDLQLLAASVPLVWQGEFSTLLVLILKVEVAKQRIAEHTQPPADGQKCQRTQEGGCGNLLENPKIAEDQHLNQPTNEGD